MFGVTAPLYEDLIYKGRNTLIAGTTGSGKSVLLNGVINSILYEDAANHQMALIDLKIVEFSKYKNTTHCIGCATTARSAEQLLTSIYHIIKARLTDMEARGLTIYDGATLHLIVDEMAELMLDGKECATLLQRICQIGRAAKVQVIAATQCPLASVIPTKMAGCEKLPMYGQALILKPGKDVEKINIPMIPEEWLDKIIEYRTV